MSKLNSILMFCLVLFIHLNLEIYAAEPANFTQQWTTEFNKRSIPNVLKVKDRLFFADLYNNTVHMWTLDGLVNNTCEFFISPNRILLYNFGKTFALGNGKLVFQGLLGQNSEDKRTNWDLYVIADPYNCSNIKTLELDAKNANYAFESTVPYHDSFDIFGPSRQGEKVPRRFNDLGEAVPLEDHLEVEASLFNMLIEPIKPYDGSEGYICKIIYRGDDVSWLLRLDSKFQLVKKAEISVRPEAIMSATYDKVISLCHEYYDHDTSKWTVTCDLYDPKNLNRTASVMLYKSEESYSDVDFKVVNLPDGSAVVALGFWLRGYVADKGLAAEYYLQRINAVGSIEKPVHVDTYYNMINIGSEMRVLLLNQAEVCLIVSDTLSFSPLKERLITKCINMLN